MNPWDLSASDLLLWGVVAHLVADWLLQSNWMAANKAKRNDRYWLTTPEHEGRAARPSRWWDRHPAAYVHAGIHGIALALVFGWVAVPLAVAHLLIDTRTPVAWWARLVRQTAPKVPVTTVVHPTLRFGRGGPFGDQRATVLVRGGAGPPMVDVGLLVRMAVDQVFHIVCIAVAALLVTL